MGDGGKNDTHKVDEQVTHGASKGKGKPYCYRCLTKGHVNTECTTTISCGMCDSDNHVTKACPYEKGAKPTAILCGQFCVAMQWKDLVSIIFLIMEKRRHQVRLRLQ
jgi:hypothetical protein